MKVKYFLKSYAATSELRRVSITTFHILLFINYLFSLSKMTPCGNMPLNMAVNWQIGIHVCDE